MQNDPETSEITDALRELYQQRTDLMLASQGMYNRCRAICIRACGGNRPAGEKAHLLIKRNYAQRARKSSRGRPPAPVVVPLDLHWLVAHLEPLLCAEITLEIPRAALEAQLSALAARLPVWGSFGAGVSGFGALSLAKIIGECGDLGNYANPAKLWKRMGLGLVNGERQRRACDPALAREMGYSPRRRAVMFVIGDCLIKQQSAYRAVYLERLAFEHQKLVAAGFVPASSCAETVENWRRRALPPIRKIGAKEFDKACHASVQMLHMRAQRFMEKRFLRDLWRAWRNPQPARLMEAA